jgi:hypothetical protein
MTLTGVTEAMLQNAVITQQHQPFAIPIKATNGVNVTDRDVALQGEALPVIGKLAEYAIGFVKNQIAIGGWAGCFDRFMPLNRARRPERAHHDFWV